MAIVIMPFVKIKVLNDEKMNAVYAMIEIWYDIDLCVDDGEKNLKNRGVFKEIECSFGYTSRDPKSSSNYRGYCSIITASLVYLIASVRQSRSMVTIIQG